MLENASFSCSDQEEMWQSHLNSPTWIKESCSKGEFLEIVIWSPVVRRTTRLRNTLSGLIYYGGNEEDLAMDQIAGQVVMRTCSNHSKIAGWCLWYADSLRSLPGAPVVLSPFYRWGSSGSEVISDLRCEAPGHPFQRPWLGFVIEQKCRWLSHDLLISWPVEMASLEPS